MAKVSGNLFKIAMQDLEVSAIAVLGGIWISGK